MLSTRTLTGLVLLGASFSIFAEPDPAPAGEKQTAEQFMASLKPQHGEIKLPGGIASLKLPDDFYYLNPDDAERILVDAWGNPPEKEKTLGMIVPSAISPLTAEGWAVIITYTKDGHVKDDDASKIDYAKLLKQMQDSSEEDNKQRQEKGYRPLYLVGWAEPPTYDAATHKMIWAQDLSSTSATGEGDKDSLNYNIRVLGREGVLVLNAVAAMHDLQNVKAEMPKVLAFTNFNDGSKYSDFNPSTDKLAAYGLAALVAGGIAAKAGLFAKLGLMLFALKKFVIIGAVAIASFFGKLFKKKPKV